MVGNLDAAGTERNRAGVSNEQWAMGFGSVRFIVSNESFVFFVVLLTVLLLTTKMQRKR
jgi:hypothetical protein